MGVFGADANRYGGIVVDQVGNDESVRLISQQIAAEQGFVHQAGLSVTDWDPDRTLPELMRLIMAKQAFDDSGMIQLTAPTPPATTAPRTAP